MTERIGAIPALVGGASRTGSADLSAGGRLGAGAVVRATVIAAGADGLTVITGDGQTLRLPGIAAESLAPGSSLSLKVVATEPRLLLQPLADEPSATPGGRPTASLREADQLQMNRLGWAAPEAGRLATAWRVQVLSRLATQLDRNAMAAGQRIPAWLLQADPDIGRQNGAHPLPNSSWWMFPAFAWGGIPMTLSLYDGDEEEAAPDNAPLPRRELSLRITLPGLGLLRLRLRLTARQGLLLAMSVETETARRHVEACAAEILAVIRQAGGRLMQYRVKVQHAEMPRLPRRAMRQPAGLALPPRQLFELAAQILIIVAGLPRQPATAG